MCTIIANYNMEILFPKILGVKATNIVDGLYFPFRLLRS